MAIETRLARSEDKPAVAAFCARIWEGHDYVPEIWDQWLTDPQGVLMVATLEDTPIAVVRAALQSPGEAWLEGMRVDPDHRQHRVATILSHALLQEIATRGVTVARLMTAYDNAAVHHMCEHTGFRLVVRTRQRQRPLEVGAPSSALRPLTSPELPLARALLQRQGIGGRRVPSFLDISAGLTSLGGGVWGSWTEERLRTHLARGELWTWSEAGVPQAIAVVCPHRRRAGVYEVGLLEGTGSACTALLDALVYRPAVPETGADYPAHVRISAPLALPRLHRAAAAAGYRFNRQWRGEMWVFEGWLDSPPRAVLQWTQG